MRLPTIALASFVGCSLISIARAQGLITRENVSSSGAEALGGDSFYCSISSDGRFVAFCSKADNLVASDTNLKYDAFVRDRESGVTERINLGPGDVETDGSTYDRTVLSADGRFVAFSSLATNLVIGDTNGVSDVFVRDRLLHVTERVSVDSGGAESDGASSAPAMSADGRFVAFASSATNLVVGDANGVYDIFVHDRVTGVTERASVSSSGAEGDAGSTSRPAISADGRFVAFASKAGNFAPPDATPDTFDVFVHDRFSGQTLLASVDSSGVQAAGYSSDPSLSADGRFVAFDSQASGLYSGDLPSTFDVFVHDMQTGATTLVSEGFAGLVANDSSGGPSISGDGRYVVFGSAASNLVSQDTNGHGDVFLRDLLTGQTTRLSIDPSGTQGDDGSGGASIAGASQHVVFASSATNLVTGDTNNLDDVFVYDRAPGSITAFCFGDGSGTACPCGNNGAIGRGCANSANSNGARLSAAGFASVGADSVVLLGSGMPATSTCLYFEGSSPIPSGAGSMLGDGLFCLAGSFTRLGVKTNSSGSSSFGGPAGDTPLSVSAMIPVAGGSSHYQIFYRNSASFCTSDTFNFTNGLTITWLP